MEQQGQPQAKDRLGIIVMALILGAMLGYQFIYYPTQLAEWKKKKAAWDAAHPELAQGADVDSATTAAAGSASTAQVDTQALAQAEPLQAGPSVEHVAAIPFSTREHRIELTTAGASLSNLTLPNVLENVYKPVQSREEDLREPDPFQPLHPYIPERRSFALLPLDPALADVATRDWHHTSVEGGGHRFWLDLPSRGLRLVKTYRPPRARAEETERVFHFDLTVEVQNLGGAPQTFGYHLFGPAGMVEQDSGRAGWGQESVLATREEGRIRLEMESVSGFSELHKPDQSLAGDVAYFGVATKYFTSVVIPVEAEVTQVDAQGLLQSTGRTPSEAEQEDPDGLGNQGLVRGLVKEFSIAPGATAKQEFWVYVGPRQEPAIFDQAVYAEKRLDYLVYFGWSFLGSMGRLLMWVLDGLHGLLGNWGLAILCLTFLVRGLMTPLSMWSQKNMLRMQTLAPEINKLKEKYSKKDGSMTPEQQRQFQQAQMDLWRKHGVNPIGCIGPMFLQMPIFFGLYNALNYASQLRHSEFGFWITDLSIPDVVFRLPFTIPLIGTNALSILPLLMVATYLLQQKLQPKPSDPKQAEQQKMMKFIFPLFGFLLYTMPSGLMLYFITSSMWGITEQKIIKKRLGLTSDAASESSDGKGAKQKAKQAKAAKK